MTEGRKDMEGRQENIRTTESAINTDYQATKSISFAPYVASALLQLKDDDYITERVVISFNSTRKVSDETSFDADERNIREWFAMMMRKGTSPATLRRYLGKLHAMYCDYAGVTSEGEALFDELRKAIGQKRTDEFSEKSESPHILISLALKIRNMQPDKAAIGKALLYLFYLGGAPYSTVAELRFDDQVPDIDQLKEIVDSMPRERRSYVFPLRQSRIRPTQLYRDMSRDFAELLSDLGQHGIGPVSPDAIRGWWIEAALHCGVSCEAIVSIVPSVPQAYSWLNVVKPRQMSEAEKFDRLREVANMIGDTTSHWYAMFMRDNNTPDEITECIEKSAPAFMKDFHVFYPTHKIVKRESGKKVVETVPFLPHILFFKSRPDAVKPLFDIIGGLAWCFRTTNRPDAPYAVIPKREMDNFQKCIGVLDESVKIEFVQNPDLVPDRHIRITGGAFKGYEGTIYKQNGTVEDSDMRYFLLRINDRNNVVWQVRIEEGFIEPIKED